jgi:hypothetical protein
MGKDIIRNAEVRMQKLKLITLRGAACDTTKFFVRRATAKDIPRLREVIEASVRGLQAGDYSAAHIEGALKSVYGGSAN